MQREMEAHRRALLIVYRRYMRAERAWRLAQAEALSWFPAETRPTVPPIGDPGSRLRRLYERRDRALVQLTAIRQTLHASQRHARRTFEILALPAS